MTVRPPDVTDRNATPTPALQVFPVTVGHYQDQGWPDLDTEAEAGRVADLLAVVGGRTSRWAEPALERGAGSVQRRLREWADSASRPGAAPSTVLYWAGHGWSDGDSAVLATCDTPNPAGAYGVTPTEFAYAIRDRQAALQATASEVIADGQGWALVVVDACRSKRFTELVTASLTEHDLPFGVLLIGVSGDGATTLGRFTAALRGALTATYQADRRIPVAELGRQFQRLLPGCAVSPIGNLAEAELVPVFPPVASWMSAPLAEIRHLEEVLDDLDADERQHFLAKAQGSEHGELSWFFEGRENELTQISDWLRQASSGMLIVTGRAGSGKSALLGNVLVRSLPALRDALARRGLVDAPRPGTTAPPESVFDAVIHLSSLDLAQATTRVADAAGIGPMPSRVDPEAGVASDLDFLADELAGRARPFTVLTDALDESLDPLDIARSLLARLAALPGVRVLAGTRASTNEAPDTPADDENLLDALSADTPDARRPYGWPETDNSGGGGLSPGNLIRVGQDQKAIRRYVAGRLRAARDYGVAGRAIEHMSEVSDQDINRAAAEISGRGQEFLFARLAAYELIADPRLLTPGMTRSRGQMLQGTHQDLFGRALHRLADHDDRYPVLMRALSLALGRGIPEADGIWATIAAALDHAQVLRQTEGPCQDPRAAANRESNGTATWAEAIGGLLDQAPAYITADTYTGRDGSREPGTVYRLAHRTFVEYFAKHPPAGQGNGDPRWVAASALLHAAAQTTSSGPGRLPDYMVRHLSGHAAEAGMWDDLANLPRVLDRIDPNAVTTDAIRTLFGRRAVPPPIAGIIGTREALTDARPADRPGLRQLATTIHSSRRVVGEPAIGWGIGAAHAGSSTVHVKLNGHTSAVTKVISLTLPDKRVVLASSSDDGTIRLWDPVRATPIGVPMKGHASTVEAICVLPTPSGRTVLASAGSDGTVRLWDPATGQPASPPMIGHTGPVWGVCAVPGREPGQPPALATTGEDGTLRLWDPATGQPARPPMTSHTALRGVCIVPSRAPGQPPMLATTGSDGTARLWDPATGQPAAPPITGHTKGGAWGVCAVPGREPGQPSTLATTGEDGTVRLWNPATGQPAGPPMTGHTGPVWGVCAVPGREPGQPPALATTGEDGTVRLWNPATGQPAGPPMTGHTGPVWGVCAVPGREPGQPPTLATAGDDGTIRIWDPATGQPAAPPATGRIRSVWAVCVVPGREPGQPPTLATAGDDGTIRIWDPATGQPAARPITGPSWALLGVCIVPGREPGQPPTLASAGRDGTVRLWDPATGQPASPPMTGHSGPVWGVCALPGWEPGQPPTLASAGRDGTVRLWDPATGQPAAPPITGHTGSIWGICVVPAREPGQPPSLATTGDDGTVRLWDPATGQPSGPPMTGHTGSAWGVCALPGRDPGQPPTILATTGRDGTVRLWDAATGQPAAPPITGHTGSIWGICVVPGDPGQPPTLATTGEDGTVRLWNPATGQPSGPPMTGHTGSVWGACALPGREPGQPPTLATAGDDGTVRLWDPARGRALGEPLVTSPEAVRALAPCAAPIADCVSARGDGSVHTWTAATATLRAVASPPDVSAIATLVSANHVSMLTGDVYGQIRLNDLLTGHEIGPPLRVDHQAVLALHPLPARPPTARVAAASGSGAISIITVHPDGRLEPGPVLHGSSSPVRALCLIRHHNGLLLAAAGNDATIRVWDLTATDASGSDASSSATAVADRLVGHDGWIWSMAAMPTLPDLPPRLASAGADHTVRLWDPVSGRSLGQPLTGHTDQVRAVIAATSDDGRVVLVSGGHDGAIRLWDPVTGTPGIVMPIGIPVHAMLQQRPDPASRARTGGGATITVGLRTGILALDLHSDLFHPAPQRVVRASAAPRHHSS